MHIWISVQSLFSVVVQSLGHVRLFLTPWTAACYAPLSFTISPSLLKLIPTESVITSNHLILCHPLLLLPSVFPSIRVFSSESTLYQVAKVLELQLQRQSFLWIFRVDFLIKPGLIYLISLLSKGLSSIFSNTTVWSINSWALSIF